MPRDTRPGLFDALFAPRAIALYGASGDPTKNTARPQRYLRKHGYAGRIAPINRTRREVLGETAYPRLAEVPYDVDHAFIMVPPGDVPAACAECFERRVPVVTIFSDGFGETGAAGLAVQDQLVAGARAAGVRLVGPNSIGLISTAPGMALSVSAVLDLESLRAGPLAVVSQSGSLIGALLSRGAARGIGFSRLVSIGNEADLSIGELVDQLVTDDATRAVLLFLESLRDAPLLAAAARRAFAAGKPVLVYKLGRSEAGETLARSHTGAIAGDDRATDAFFRAHGMLRVRHFEGLIEAAHLAIGQRAPRGRRVAMVTTTGGGAAVVADPLGAAGVELVGPPAALANAFRALGVRIGDSPLVDLTLAGARGSVYEPVLGGLLGSDHCDAVLAAVGSSGQFHPQVAIEPIVRAQRAHPHKPLAVFIAPDAPASLSLLAAAGIAAFRSPEACADALAGFLAWRAPATPPPTDAAVIPALKAILARRHPLRAERLFEALGVPQAPAQWLAAATTPIEIEFPVALKIASPDIEHKTEVGGVELGLKSAPAAAAAARRIGKRVNRAQPKARLDGFIAATMQRGLMEVILGFRRDAQVGPIVLVGAGGTLAELHRDVALRVAPVSEAEALEMIGEVRGFALLDGFRGAPRGDRDALARAIAAFSKLAALDAVAEAEINPLLVRAAGEGVIGVDALLVLGESRSRSTRATPSASPATR